MTQTIDLGDGPIEVIINGQKVFALDVDRDTFEIFSKGKRWGRLQGNMLFLDGLKGAPETGSGTEGDIVLPNHYSCIRGFQKDGQGTLPMVKLTGWDTPVFGRTAKTLPPNEAFRIGHPSGILVVTNQSQRQTGLFVLTGPEANPITLISDPANIFSTRDGDGGKIVVAFDKNQASPINGVIIGGFQIQNRMNEPKHIGWSAYGTL